MSATPRILVVDDSKNLRSIVKRYLTAGGLIADFKEASNGEEAKEILQLAHVMEEPIQVIILDWMMPHLSGLDFLKQIRETEQFKSFPSVVMLTAETYSEQISACIAFKVAAYVTKPFTQEDVVLAVQKALQEQQKGNSTGNSEGGLPYAV